MGNCISSSSVSAQSSMQAAHQQASIPVSFPPKVWRDIAAVATADSVLTLRQVSPEMKAAVDSLTQTNLNRINQHADSTIDLYQSNNELCSVTKDPEAQIAMARNENISPALQEFFANSLNVDVRRALARNTSLTSEAAQDRLVCDEDNLVREALAGNLNLTEEIQEELAYDDSSWVRFDLSRNPSLMMRPQRILADDDGDFILFLARVSNLTTERQQTLAQDDDAEIREALAENPNLTMELQQTLADDDAVEVRRALAGNPNLTMELQQTLADDGAEVRRALAGNCNLTPELQQTLANDDDSEVRRALAHNRNLTAEVQQMIAEDDDIWVLFELSKNPNLVVGLQQTLAQEALTLEDGSLVLEGLAENISLTTELQQTLAEDGGTEVRIALAGNRNLMTQLHQILAQDDDAEVRRVLAQTPEAHNNIDTALLDKGTHRADTLINRTLDALGITDEQLDNFASEEVEDLKCPISHRMMRDPVSTNDGHTYERAWISEWLSNHDTSPLTGLELANKDLVYNEEKAAAIVTFLERNAAQINPAN